VTALDVRGPAWLTGALCAEVDPAIMFPDKGGSSREGKKVCAGCDLAAACHEWAVVNEIPDGIFGGVTARERRMARRSAA
jgi:Transcription factor WhiB.